jgi:hypothetical protein
MEGMRQSSSVQPKGATRIEDLNKDLEAAMAEAARTLKSCSGGQQKTVINKGNWSKEVTNFSPGCKYFNTWCCSL